MDIERFRETCLTMPMATEDMPFGEDVLVFRLKGKIFAALNLQRNDCGIMKCDAERAIALREQYPGIQGAFHWNKKYWNQVPLEGCVDDSVILDLVRHAWEEVNKKLPQKTQVIYE